MTKASQNFLKWLFSLERSEKRALQIAFDVLAVPITFFLAYFMRLETLDFLYNRDTYISVLIALTTVFGVYASRGFHNSFTRHISVEIAYSIAIGAGVSCAALFSGMLLLELQIPRSVPLIFAVLLCVFSLGVRLFIRALGQSIVDKDKENVAIYGAGAAGIQLMEALRQSPLYSVRLFIDDNPELDGKNLGGVLIQGLDHATKKFKKLSIQTLLLATPNNIDATRERIFDRLPDYPMKLKTIPSITSLITGDLSITDLKDIKVEDLLGRQPVKYSTRLFEKNITGKRVLVTGAGGSIGSELCRQIIQWKPKQLILLDVSEFASYTLLEEIKCHPASVGVEITTLIGSVQDRLLISRVFDRFIIDTTYHAAAYKHVPLMEQNAMQCIANNVFGTLNMVELAIAFGVKNFILVSTDKAVRPTNYMGASKRIAEVICQTLSMTQKSTCFATVRFGNVLGSSGSVVPLFKKQIKNGGPITLTHPDITRYFMTIPEAAQLVIQAGSIANGGEVFVLDMGKPVKILDLAKKMATLSGLKPILNSKDLTKDGEINITFDGLRPGEKLFEELSYNADLVETMHPRIKTTTEQAVPLAMLKRLLSALEDALDDADDRKLYEVVASFTDGVSEINSSHHHFNQQLDTDQTTVLSITGQNRK